MEFNEAQRELLRQMIASCDKIMEICSKYSPPSTKSSINPEVSVSHPDEPTMLIQGMIDGKDTVASSPAMDSVDEERCYLEVSNDIPIEENESIVVITNEEVIMAYEETLDITKVESAVNQEKEVFISKPELPEAALEQNQIIQSIDQVPNAFEFLNTDVSVYLDEMGPNYHSLYPNEGNVEEVSADSVAIFDPGPDDYDCITNLGNALVNHPIVSVISGNQLPKEIHNSPHDHIEDERLTVCRVSNMVVHSDNVICVIANNQCALWSSIQERHSAAEDEFVDKVQVPIAWDLSIGNNNNNSLIVKFYCSTVNVCCAGMRDWPDCLSVIMVEHLNLSYKAVYWVLLLGECGSLWRGSVVLYVQVALLDFGILAISTTKGNFLEILDVWNVLQYSNAFPIQILLHVLHHSVSLQTFSVRLSYVCLVHGLVCMISTTKSLSVIHMLLVGIAHQVQISVLYFTMKIFMNILTRAAQQDIHSRSSLERRHILAPTNSVVYSQFFLRGSTALFTIEHLEFPDVYSTGSSIRFLSKCTNAYPSLQEFKFFDIQTRNFDPGIVYIVKGHLTVQQQQHYHFTMLHTFSKTGCWEYIIVLQVVLAIVVTTQTVLCGQSTIAEFCSHGVQLSTAPELRFPHGEELYNTSGSSLGTVEGPDTLKQPCVMFVVLEVAPIERAYTCSWLLQYNVHDQLRLLTSGETSEFSPWTFNTVFDPGVTFNMVQLFQYWKFLQRFYACSYNMKYATGRHILWQIAGDTMMPFSALCNVPMLPRRAQSGALYGSIAAHFTTLSTANYSGARGFQSVFFCEVSGASDNTLMASLLHIAWFHVRNAKMGSSGRSPFILLTFFDAYFNRVDSDFRNEEPEPPLPFVQSLKEKPLIVVLLNGDRRQLATGSHSSILLGWCRELATVTFCGFGLTMAGVGIQINLGESLPWLYRHCMEEQNFLSPKQIASGSKLCLSVNRDHNTPLVHVSRTWHIAWSEKMALQDDLDLHRVMDNCLQGHLVCTVMQYGLWARIMVLTKAFTSVSVSEKVSFLWMIAWTVGSVLLSYGASITYDYKEWLDGFSTLIYCQFSDGSTWLSQAGDFSGCTHGTSCGQVSWCLSSFSAKHVTMVPVIVFDPGVVKISLSLCFSMCSECPPVQSSLQHHSALPYPIFPHNNMSVGLPLLRLASVSGQEQTAIARCVDHV